MGKTKIEWTHVPGTIGESWNPITGCSKVSEGCKFCYAERMARRLAGRHDYPEAPHHFDVTLHPDRLEQPLKWKKPRAVFVCSMSDLFHKDVETDWIAHIWGVMMKAEQHIFQVLTKRPARMLQFVRDEVMMAFPNIWLGVTAENQHAADERTPILLQTPAAVRFVSVEPMLGLVNIRKSWLYPYDIDRPGKIAWVICGGESGPNARPMHPQWARDIRDQCQAADVSFFFKQWGGWLPFGQGQGPASYEDAPKCWLDVRGQSSPTYSAMMREPSALYRVGKKRAGCLLDGKEWNEFPC